MGLLLSGKKFQLFSLEILYISCVFEVGLFNFFWWEYFKNSFVFEKGLLPKNPEFAEKQQQQAEINELKLQVNDLTKGISDLMKMNKDLLARFNINTEK